MQYLITPFIQINDINGLPIVGAKIYVYDADTSNLSTTYSNFDGALNTNPVITDTLGNATIIADESKLYDVSITDANDNLLFTKKYIRPGEGGGDVANVSVSGYNGVNVTVVPSGQSTVYVVSIDNTLIPTFSDLERDYQHIMSAGDNIQITTNNIINVTGRRELAVEYPITASVGSNNIVIGVDYTYLSADRSPDISANKVLAPESTKIDVGGSFQVLSSIDVSGYKNHSVNVKGGMFTLPNENEIASALYDISAFPTYDVFNGYTGSANGMFNYLSGAVDDKLDKSFSSNFYPMTGNPSGFLTAHQSLTNYYTKSDTSSKQELSAAFTNIPSGISLPITGWNSPSGYSANIIPSAFKLNWAASTTAGNLYTAVYLDIEGIKRDYYPGRSQSVGWDDLIRAATPTIGVACFNNTATRSMSLPWNKISGMSSIKLVTPLYDNPDWGGGQDYSAFFYGPYSNDEAVGHVEIKSNCDVTVVRAISGFGSNTVKYWARECVEYDSVHGTYNTVKDLLFPVES